MTWKVHRLWATPLAALGSVLLMPSVVQAQAWPLPQGTGSVSTVYHQVFVRDHLFAGGERQDIGHIRSHVFGVDVDYGVSDRLSIRAALPYVAAKYEGSQGHGSPSSAHFHFIDDGTYHSAFQDLRAEVRYAVREFPVALAPLVAVTVPTHDYEFFAHSAVGLKMAELQLGSYLGVLIGRRTSVQSRFSYGIYERVAGRRRYRGNLDAEVAWLVARTVRLLVFQAGQFSHGGIEMPFDEIPVLRQQYWWPHHDRLGQAHFLNVGAGVTFDLRRSVGVHASLARTVCGANTHAASYGVTLGASWAFSTGGRPAPHHSRQSP